MCGGFTCSKNALIALNLLYILVAFVLIGVAVYGRASALVTNLPIIGGILACGVLLILISILGLVGSAKHHQVVLFFYMLILFLLFLIQFSIACACLAVNEKQQEQLAEEGWNQVSKMDEELLKNVQKTFQCCGFNGTYHDQIPIKNYDHCAADGIKPNCDLNNNCKYPDCMQKLQSVIDYAFKLCGGIGLFFSFTEVIAAFLAKRYRNQINPDQANREIYLRKEYH